MYTSSLSSNAKVDVFLNFKEEERRGFLSHLSHALARLDIRCFINDRKEESTEKRKQVPANVLRAIAESRVAIILLSKNYASSSWCLNELVEIMETKLMMVPVYYGVDISDVQYLKGSFEEDLSKHGQSESCETIAKWKACLTKLTDTKPKFSPKSSEDEAKLVRDITRHVSGLLSASRPHKELLRGKACESTSRMTSWSRRVSITGKSSSIIAMDRQTDSIYEILKLESTSEVRVIGITGVEGIGKTTIARHLYKKLSLAFEDPCFFEDESLFLTKQKDESSRAGISKSRRKDYINEKLSPACHQNHYYSLETSRNFHDQGHDLSALSGSQEELLSTESLKRKATETLRCNFGSGDNKRTKIGHNQTLIIVDNIGIEELDMVREGVDRLCPGSRVIVTTQEKSFLLARGVEHVYEMDCLKYDEALELFSECAFEKPYPPANLEELSVRAVKLTGCLPLGLKLLGSFLRDKSEEDWECELKRLEGKKDETIVELPKFKAQGRPKEDKECRGSKQKQKEKIKPWQKYRSSTHNLSTARKAYRMPEAKRSANL